MQQRKLGRTGLNCSVLGLGTSRLTSVASNVSASEAMKLVQEALDLGINFLDTADIYGQGDSERVLGRALRGRRSKAILASKVGYTLSKHGVLVPLIKPFIKPIISRLRAGRQVVSKVRSGAQSTAILKQDFSAGHLVSAVEASLRRIGTDYLDIVYFHDIPREAAESSDALEAADRLLREGKARCIGLSVENDDPLPVALRHPVYSVVQVPAVRRTEGAAAAIADQLAERAIGMVGNRAVSANPDKAGVGTSTAHLGLSREQALLLEGLVHGRVTCILTGTTSREHLRENVAAIARLNEFVAEGSHD